MKKYLILFLSFVILFPMVSWGQIFSQNFNSSTTLTDYFNSSPTANQFRNISTTNANSTISVSTNALVMTKNITSTSNAYAERNVDFNTVPTGMQFQFTFNVSGGSAATSALLIYVGGDVSNSSTVPSLANLYARFAINTTSVDGVFQIRDITNLTDGLHTFVGAQTITWVLNNTGSTKSYTAPDNSSEQIADDKMDVWVGTTKEFDDISVQTDTQTLARFKFLTNAWTDATIFTIDNILISNETALPVELTSFTNFVKGNKVNLNWRTATEVNNYGFEIERQKSVVSSQNSVVGVTHSGDEGWERIGFVQGNGNCNSPKNYAFTDEPTGGKEFNYRLKQIDFDGKFEYSDISTATLQNVNAFALEQNYPNPFNPVTRISYTIPERSEVKLKVYDMLAQEVAELASGSHEAGHYQVTFDGSKLPSGAYFYKLDAGKYVEVKKLLLVK